MKFPWMKRPQDEAAFESPPETGGGSTSSSDEVQVQLAELGADYATTLCEMFRFVVGSGEIKLQFREVRKIKSNPDLYELVFDVDVRRIQHAHLHDIYAAAVEHLLLRGLPEVTIHFAFRRLHD